MDDQLRRIEDLVSEKKDQLKIRGPAQQHGRPADNKEDPLIGGPAQQ
jgi:hypothetical protein